MTLSIQSKQGLSMMSTLDTAVFDDSCKDSCGQSSKFVVPTVVAKRFRTPRVFPCNPIVNKSCKIDRCDNNMHQILKNMIMMILTQGLELKLSVL